MSETKPWRLLWVFAETGQKIRMECYAYLNLTGGRGELS